MSRIDGYPALPADQSGQDAIVPDGPEHARTQYGALCWRVRGKRAQVLLVTSRDTGRWIIPKGWPMSGRLPYEAALREAWEEAGAEGRIDADPTGEFPYRKMLKSGSDLPVRVEVFPLLVERLAADYPERRQRRRRWFDPAKAARKVAEPGLGAIILQFCMMVERSRAAEAARVAPVTIAG